MYCYTLNIGGVPERGIRIAMVEKYKVPAVVVGDQEKGDMIPIDQAWFDHIVTLQQVAKDLPMLKGKALSLPMLMNCELEGTDPSEYKLVGRPNPEPDTRALVHLIPPEGAEVRYTGCYKIEKEEEGKVVAKYPKLDSVVGLEHIAGKLRGEVLLIMHLGSSVRIILRNEQVYRYKTILGRISPRMPRIIDVSPQRQGSDSWAA